MPRDRSHTMQEGRCRSDAKGQIVDAIGIATPYYKPSKVSKSSRIMRYCDWISIRTQRFG